MTHNLFYEYGHALYILNIVCICSMITNGKHAKNYMMNEWDFNEKPDQTQITMKNKV